MKPTVLHVSPKEASSPLDRYLAHRMGISRKKAKKLLDARVVFVNRKRVWIAHHQLRAGDQVEVHMPSPSSGSGEYPILYEDGDYMVVNKPPGILSCGAGSVENALRAEHDRPLLRAVHRLDRDTSGCLLFAGSTGARDAMLPLFRKREVEKGYQAIAVGRVPARLKKISTPLNGQPALTTVNVLRATAEASHLELRISTGRTHQIRRHLAFAHHPLVGDKQYATGEAVSDGIRSAPRHMLHAYTLSFAAPKTGKRIRCTAPLPADFKACLRVLRLS